MKTDEPCDATSSGACRVGLGCFLGLGEGIDLLGADLAAATIGTILVGLFGVMDAARDHDHCALSEMHCVAFADTVKAGVAVQFDL